MENTTPLFSVLIANYNNANYIDQAIQSVFKQTYQHWEIVILDDCSTDNSIEYLEKYTHSKNIRIQKNDENKGVGFTKKRLVELAYGSIVGFLDADDALTEDAIEVMMIEHERNIHASMIYSRLFLCDKSLNVVSKSMYAIELKENETFLDFPPGSISHFATFKIDNYKMTLGIDPYLKMSEDMDIYYKLEETGPLLLVDKFLYYYRQHSGSISLNKNSFDAFVWNIIAKTVAAKRRKIDIFSVLKQNIPNKWELVSFYENSLDYRLGSMILAPLRAIKKMFKFGD